VRSEHPAAGLKKPGQVADLFPIVAGMVLTVFCKLMKIKKPLKPKEHHVRVSESVWKIINTEETMRLQTFCTIPFGMIRKS